MEEKNTINLDRKQWKQKYLEAIQANNTEEVLWILQTSDLHIDDVLEVDDPDMVLASYKQGYWLPDYKMEKSWAMGIHLCVLYNALDTAMMLLERGTSMNAMTDGKTALHIACDLSNSDFVALLLAYGASVDILSLSGHAPLHCCITKQSVECAKLLLLKGADVNLAADTTDKDTPLHRVTRFGLPEHVSLYLQHGASINAVNSTLRTPLMNTAVWAFNQKDQVYNQDHQLVCRILLDHGADPLLQDIDHKTALHRAAWNVDHVVMEMLLEAGSDTRATDINGCVPLQYLLKLTDRRLRVDPEVCYLLLLNYNAATIYPPQFHMFLQKCHFFPNVVEILVNCYPHLMHTRKWRPAIPDECYLQHKDFYDSMFAVCSNTPRSLLHLTRCAIRAGLGGFCHNSVAKLPLPSGLKRYLLLYPEALLTQPATAAESFDMDDLNTRKLEVKQWKQKYLDAIKADNAQEVLRILHTSKLDVDTVLDVEDPGLVLASYKQGYWLPDYKLEKSWAMGLHVCVLYNALATAMVLLENGAATNKMPNGKTPLHVACQIANSDFVELLVTYFSRINIVSLSGHTPLHHCTTKESIDCAKLLLLKGANVNKVGDTDDKSTPLHRVAQFGLPELVSLYLQHGASVDALNSSLETPLMMAASSSFSVKDQVYSSDHQLICRILLDSGADPNLQDEDHKTALHRAAWNFDQIVMQMLLEAGSDIRTMDINACVPLQYLLRMTDSTVLAEPEVCFLLLLNFNAARIYPPQFHMVLQYCHSFPKVVEILVNCYPLLLPTRKWRPAIPEDCYKQHKDFYDSMFAVCSKTPRSLLHLTRCAIRAGLGGFCHYSVAKLPLPSSIKRYLLLYPEGTLY